MTLEILLIFCIIGLSILIFAFEWLPLDITGLLIAVLLMITGLVTPEEGISGFSSPATITILGIMLLSIGLDQSGAIDAGGRYFRKIATGGETGTVGTVMIVSGVLSAFINTTAVVLVFMGVLIRLSASLKISSSKILMPLSFAGILGGSCTLIGTSTNILISAISDEYGYGDFDMFEFTSVGVIIFAVGFLYLVTIGYRLIPARRSEESLTQEYRIKEFLFMLKIPMGSRLVRMNLGETELHQYERVTLLEIKPEGEKPHFPRQLETFKEGDELLVKGAFEDVNVFRSKYKLEFAQAYPMDDSRLNTREMSLCEVVITPNSRLVGMQVNRNDIRARYGGVLLGIKKVPTLLAPHRYRTLEMGDSLLLEFRQSDLKRLYDSSDFSVLREYPHFVKKTYRRYLSVAILLGVIFVAAMGIIPILVSALAGCVLMFVTGCLNLQRAYRQLNWNIIFLLAGVIPLGTAIHNTGADQWLVDQILMHVMGQPARVYLSIIFFVSALLTAFISNNATAAILAPIAITLSNELGVEPKQLLLTVLFGANSSFFTPIGYQTNTLIYKVGDYQFKDFTLVGGILTIIVGILTIWLVPILI